LQVAVRPKHDVFGFDIAMDHPRLMSGKQRVAYLHRQSQDLAGGEHALPDSGTKSFAVNEFGGDDVGAGNNVDVEDGEDVWMIETRRGKRLLPEANDVI